jgi:sec-independent protein translocase protein TatA
MLPLAILGLGIQELVVILLLVVFIFGARKIPEVARGLGEGIRGFRSSLRGDEEETDKSNDVKNVTDGSDT